MNNSRLFSLLSIAFLLSYAGGTICTTDEEQQTANAVVGVVTWATAEVVDNCTDKKTNSYYNYIHALIKASRSNALHKSALGLYGANTGSFHENRIQCLKPDDGYGVLEALAETGGSIVTSLIVTKACDISGVSKMIEDSVGHKIPPKVKVAIEVLMNAVVTHVLWTGLAKGLVNSIGE